MSAQKTTPVNAKSWNSSGPAAGDGLPRAPQPIDRLLSGTEVILVGLSNAAYNEQMGRVTGFDEGKARYQVALSDSSSAGASLSVKLSNLSQVVRKPRVTGTSQELLNGRNGTTARYDHASGRYRVAGLLSGGSSGAGEGSLVALKAENVVLPVGTRVVVEGVQSRPALNGKAGAVTEVDEEAARYVILLPDETLRLRFGAVRAL